MSQWTLFENGLPRLNSDGLLTSSGERLHILGPAYRGGTSGEALYLATQQVYSNYWLTLEYRWGAARFAPAEFRKRNSGLLLHTAAAKAAPYPDAIEFQIQEGDVGDMVGLNVRALQGDSHSGAFVWPNQPAFGSKIYQEPLSFGGVDRQWLRKDGAFESLTGWNRLDAIVQEDMAAFLVNGRIVNSIYGIQHKKSDGYTKLTNGRIGLQIQAAEIEFRNMRLRPNSA